MTDTCPVCGGDASKPCMGEAMCDPACPRNTHFVGSNVWVLIAVVVVFLIAGLLGARASSIEEDTPDMAAYYESLMQPDNDTSCCGPGDAYYADNTDRCSPAELAWDATCKFVAIITDTRPDLRIVGNKTINRTPIKVGTRIIVPKSKVRPQPIPNPTDHNVIFVSVTEAGHVALCWEPVAGL